MTRSRSCSEYGCFRMVGSGGGLSLHKKPAATQLCKHSFAVVNQGMNGREEVEIGLVSRVGECTVPARARERQAKTIDCLVDGRS